MGAQDKDVTAQIGSGFKATAPKSATPKEVKAFTTGVDKAQSDYNKALQNAKNTLAQAKKQGNKVVAASASSLINQLTTVVKPALEVLQKGQNPNAAYTGDYSDITKALGGGTAGSTGSAGGAGGGTGSGTGGDTSGGGTDSSGNLPTTVDSALEYQKAMDEKTRQNAFQTLRATLEGYGLGSLADTITRMFQMGLTAEEALVKMKYDKTVDPATGKAWNSAYTTRFSGNEKRIAKGLNALSEAEYIMNEDSYAETLRSYGLGNTLSVDRLENERKFAEYIGNDVSPVEFKDRVSTAADRVINADAGIKDTFKTFYPNITDNDLIAYFLNPSDTIGKLKEKATAAEIGAAAKAQGLGTNVENAEMLAKYGVDRTAALQGYQQIAEFLPTTEKLSKIYSEWGTNYTQAKGEQEIFKGNEQAAAERRRFKSLERGKFSGDSGVSSQAGSLTRSTQGTF